MSVRLLLFVAATVVVRALLAAPMNLLFSGEIVSDYWIVPYLRWAGPDILFFVVIGVIIPFVFRRFGISKAALACCVIYALLELIYLIAFTTFSADGWRGYAVLAAPIFGTVLGIYVGILVSHTMMLLVRRTA